jgi:hypothetical protein
MVHPVAYQLIVTRRGTGPDFGSIRQMSGNSAIQGSLAKNASKIRAIATTPVRHRYGWGTALSTREAVRDFIILTGFSRCQGPMIGRVSRRHKQPYKDFP